MKLARVVGTVVATRKDASLHGHRLLLVQPIDATGAALGRAIVSLDAVGAGAGETVFYVRSREASFAFDSPPATDATIVGIVDHYRVDSRSRDGITRVAS